MTGLLQIGCGTVGFAYMSAYKSRGINVIGIESDMNLVLKYRSEFKMYHTNDDLSNLTDINFIMICVNTPLKENNLDVSYLYSTIDNVCAVLKNNPDSYVVIRSTVPPFTTREYKERLDNIMKCSVKIAFQPEFIRAKSAYDDALHPWQVVIGIDAVVDNKPLVTLYNKFVSFEEINIISIEEAELLKLFHNSFNACKISFFNQCNLLVNEINDKFESKMKMKMNMNKISNILTYTCEGLINPGYGTVAGHAYYGACLPKDTLGLASLEKQYGLVVPFFKSIVDVNNIMKSTDKCDTLDGDNHMSPERILHSIKHKHCFQ